MVHIIEIAVCYAVIYGVGVRLVLLVIKLRRDAGLPAIKLRRTDDER